MAMVDISSYKMSLLKDIFNTSSIVEAIESKSSKFDPECPDTLIYENLFPYLRIPDTQGIAQTYILMAVDVMNPNRNNNYFNDMRITLWVLSHQDCMRMKNKSATRIDYIANELEDLFAGTNKFGYGILELLSNREIILNEKYQYRELIFKNLDAKESALRKDYGNG